MITNEVREKPLILFISLEICFVTFQDVRCLCGKSLSGTGHLHHSFMKNQRKHREWIHVFCGLHVATTPGEDSTVESITW